MTGTTAADLPASSFQERIWFAERMEPDAARYNVPLAWRVQRGLDPVMLGRALTMLIERHELFRTRFVPRAGRLRMVIDAPWRLTVSTVDLSGVPEAEREREALRRLVAGAQRRFDPATGRLLRAQLIDLGAGEQILALFLHHLVWDAGTEPQLLAELDRCCQAVVDGLTGLPTPAPQYREFVATEQAVQDVDGADLQFWLEQLRGAPPFLAVTPPSRTEPPGAVTVPVPEGALARLRKVAVSERASLYTLAATTLAAVLHRWTGQDDLMLGCPISQRGTVAPDDVLGPCLNTTVLRSRCPSGTTLRELLAGMRGAVLDAWDHQSTPFETLIQRLNPPRRPGWTPYADCGLSLAHHAPTTPTVAGRELAPIPLDELGLDYLAKAALTVGLVEVGDRLEGSIAYRGDRIGRADAQALARLFGRLLDRLPELLDRPVETLDLVDDADLARLVRWERGPEPAPPTSVPALLARQVAEKPDAVAVETTAGALRYRELAAHARELAGRLRPYRRGADPVAVILLGRGPRLAEAMLAAWYAGGALCAIDPATPAERIRGILDELDPYAVVSDEATPDGLAIGRPVVRVRDRPGADVAEPAAAGRHAEDDLPVDPSSTAYILFTSGTTGRPKGVAVSHGSLAQAVQGFAETFGIGRTDRVSHLFHVGFDMVLAELWSALCAGATVLPYERSVLAPELAEWVDDRRPTVIVVNATVAEALWSAGAALPGLRYLATGGSALTRVPPPDIPYRIRIGYGPTETTITVTGYELDPAEPEPLRRIGRPMPGACVYVVDPAGQRCPVGVVGELFVGGTGVAKGYWRRPELTRERFLPAGPDPSAGRVYRTGDRARWLNDGTLEFVGRVDRQVKRRGYRIEPEELESHIRADPLVRQAVVHTSPADLVGGEPALIGYLVPTGERDTAAVLERLRSRLPGYLLPDAIVWLDELPLNPRGKVDTTALPPVTRADLVGATPWAAPVSDLERRIATVWSSVLGVQQVGLHDNFFDLGGNSLLLVSMHDRLQSELEVTLPIQQLFATPTVYLLARHLGSPAVPKPQAAPVHDDPGDRAARTRAARQARADRRLRRDGREHR